VALLLLCGSAWIGYWRSQRIGSTSSSVESVERETPVLSKTGNAARTAEPELGEAEAESSDEESALGPVAANAKAREQLDLEADLRQVRRALKRQGRFDAEALGALSTVLEAAQGQNASGQSTPELEAAMRDLLEEFLDIARARLPQELLPPALQFSAALGKSRTQTVAMKEFIQLVDAAKLREEQLATAERAVTSAQLSSTRFARAAEALNAVLAAEPGHARALNLRAKLEEQQLASMRKLADALEFVRAEQALARALTLGTGSSALQSASDELQARRASAEGDTLQAFDLALQQGRLNEAEASLTLLTRLELAPERLETLKGRVRNQRIYGGFKPGESFSDALANDAGRGPVLRVLPVGRFVMGSGAAETGHRASEAPQRGLRFAGGLAMAQNEITVGEFRAFVSATSHQTDAEKAGWSASYQERSGRFVKARGVNWQDNFMGDTAKEKQPVLHVSFNDAASYARWLSEQSGKTYRLPSEAEFEYAARAGSSTAYWWGEGSPEEKLENLTGERDQSRSKRRWNTYFEGYGDGFWGPAPVRSLKPNPFGLFDMSGNVSEWTEDCWHESYMRAPESLKAWVNPGCELRVIRGASWGTSPAEARSAFRQGVLAESRSARVGFRVVREL